jgi:serine/threonine protein kinase
MFAVPGSTTQPTRFPVALTLTHSPDPSRVGIRFACEHFPFSVGRAESADLSVPADDALSRVHLEIDRDEGGFLVRDLSTNGIWVNGQHLKGRSAPLHFGTTLVLSKGTSLTFVADIPVLPDLSGEVLDGRYRLESRLHSSVKAATYRSQDVRVPKVSRAIKIFSPTLMNLANYRAEFERQATLAAQLQHPHICKVLDFGTAPVRVAGRLEPCSWLCMELMEGGNLADRLEEGLPALDTVKTWVGDVAAALAHAHRNGVAHGDLKPGCVVFDREGTAYLTDFALARSGEPESKTAVVGIPAYLAPEQWEGGLPTEATDQYSLAVLAYQMVTGSRPHEGQSVPEVRARNFQRGPAPAHEEAGRAGRESVSPAVSAVLARALSPDPAARFPDVLEFSQAFARGVTDPYQPAAKPRVFISYRRRVASGWAITFATALQDKHGCSVFVDTRALDGAPRIPDRVRKEIERCDVFVCLLAPETLGSDWVRQEIAIADDCRKPMVPIFFQEFEPRDVDTSADPHLETLLDHEAVRLYDRDADYVDAAIGRLSDRIRSLMRPS